jgi:hypothetical protein
MRTMPGISRVVFIAKEYLVWHPEAIEPVGMPVLLPGRLVARIVRMARMAKVKVKVTLAVGATSMRASPVGMLRLERVRMRSS